uniref:Uncharacterized protein n=1 Tax=Aegilops tauschii TaxID=37682 RepID=M8BZW3_AEGTA
MEMSRFSEEAVAGVVPIIVYWAYSGVHMALGHARLMDKYRLNTKDEEDSKNMVSSTSSRSTSCRSPPSLCSPWYRLPAIAGSSVKVCARAATVGVEVDSEVAGDGREYCWWWWASHR